MSQDVPKIVIATEDVPFSLSCYWCNAGDDVGSMERAVALGWKSVEYDDGLYWNFLGWCPQCVAEGHE